MHLRMSGEQTANSRLNQDSEIIQDTIIRSKKVERNVATVDVAPTIARLVRAEIPTEVNGQVLSEVIK